MRIRSIINEEANNLKEQLENITQENYNYIDILGELHYRLINRKIKCFIRQGWITEQDRSNSYLYLEVYDKFSKLYIDILDKNIKENDIISIKKKLNKNIKKTKPISK